MTQPLSVGVAGLGTVGGGVLKLLRDNADIVTARAGRPIAVTAVSARDRSKDRGVPLSGLRWYEDPVALASDPGVDVVVELIGGADGPGRALVESAIAACMAPRWRRRPRRAVCHWRSRRQSPAASR
jgi:homoserine dehydrogenase